MKRRLIPVAVFIGCLLAMQALAYIPPASFLLDRLASKRAKIGVSSLKVVMQCVHDGGSPRGETLYIKSKGHVRRERGKAGVIVCNNGRCYEKQPGGKPERLPRWAYLPYLYFAEPNANGSRYMGLLRSLGVDTGVDTITRCYSRLAFVLGAKNWERDRPQFWLDKDIYLPLRLMVRHEKSLVDILWIDWGSKKGGDWFPSKMEIRIDGKTVERCEISDVKTGVSMPKSLFKP